jgi:hypothetical protein
MCRDIFFIHQSLYRLFGNARTDEQSNKYVDQMLFQVSSIIIMSSCDSESCEAIMILLDIIS